jgi:ribonuclease E
MKKEMLINMSQSEECRIAVLENGILEELYTERASQNNYVGNIYRGRIVNLEPSIQAAFVDFGVGRNGFLHISDIEPQYFRQAGYDPEEILDGHYSDIDDSGEEGAASIQEAAGRGSSRRFRKSFDAGTRFWSR